MFEMTRRISLHVEALDTDQNQKLYTRLKRQSVILQDKTYTLHKPSLKLISEQSDQNTRHHSSLTYDFTIFSILGSQHLYTSP